MTAPRGAWRRWRSWAVFGLIACGCAPRSGPDAVVIATTWPPAAREAFERAAGSPGAVTWVDLDPGDRPEAVLARRGGVDLLLGVAPSSLAPLARRGLLESVAPGDAQPWRVVNDPPTESADPSHVDHAVAGLRAGPWAERYAGLILAANPSRPVAEGSTRPTPARSCVVTVVKGGRHAEAARRIAVRLGTADPAPIDPTAELMADLVWATTIDAGPELRAAWQALGRNGNPAHAAASLLEAPPWPPASVRKLRLTPGDAPLLPTLAEQVAPDPEARDWLLAAWNKPSRPLDVAVLDELAGAVGGRLLSEPRFRAWLRAEWTAWARQRYRRVVRVAEGWVPS